MDLRHLQAVGDFRAPSRGDYNAAMGAIHVGTSGFSYREWRGPFYPRNSKPGDWLAYYSERFNAVELDNSFYRTPKPEAVTLWRETVPDGFKFAFKAARGITHFSRLRVPSSGLGWMLDAIRPIGDRLGIVFFQLPPNFKPDNRKLAEFLASLPGDVPAAFEFRHDGWFAAETYSLLRRHGVGLVIHDADEGCTPVELTAPQVYLRMRRNDYDDAALTAWGRRFQDWAANGHDVFAFIKHEENPKAPDLATRLAAASGLANR